MLPASCSATALPYEQLAFLFLFLALAQTHLLLTCSNYPSGYLIQHAILVFTFTLSPLSSRPSLSPSLLPFLNSLSSYPPSVSSCPFSPAFPPSLARPTPTDGQFAHR